MSTVARFEDRARSSEPHSCHLSALPTRRSRWHGVFTRDGRLKGVTIDEESERRMRGKRKEDKGWWYGVCFRCCVETQTPMTKRRQPWARQFATSFRSRDPRLGLRLSETSGRPQAGNVRLARLSPGSTSGATLGPQTLHIRRGATSRVHTSRRILVALSSRCGN